MDTPPASGPPHAASGTLAVERPTPFALLIPIVALLSAPLIVASQIMAHLRMDVVDDQMFGYFGWRIAHGAVVYRDVWDNKPPGIYWINALGFLLAGDSYAGVIALCVLALLVSLAAFFIISASAYSRDAAAVATVLASFYLTHAYFQGGTNRTETFLMACELAAVALYARGIRRDRKWSWLASGALCGAAFLFKQVGLAALGAMGLHTLLLATFGDLPTRRALSRCALLSAGAASVVAAAALLLAWQAALGEAIFATFTFNRGYFAVGESRLLDHYATLIQFSWAVHPVLDMPLMMALGACIHATLWRLRPGTRPADVAGRLAQIPATLPRPMLLFFPWFVAAAYGAMVSPHKFQHYIATTLAPLMLMAGYLINVLLAERSLLVRIQQRAWVLTAFIIIGYFASDAVKRHWEKAATVWWERIEQRGVPDWEAVGRVVARHTTPQERIQCWGYMPGVYLHARRNNVCRFTTTEKLGHVKENARFVEVELLDRLTHDPPAVFVVNSYDYAWIMGQMPEKEMQPPAALAEWMKEHYAQVDEIRNNYIFKRRDLLPADPPRHAAGT
ncbi:MAG: hypothetical protein CHACPFDD_01449 [Phycisphaerae bacterium]|nr:hypothetical protein [Phycisphaerae bacterium]